VACSADYAGLEVEEHRAGKILTALGFVIKHVDAVELRVVVAAVLAAVADAVLKLELELQGGLVPNMISGVGTNFGLLVHVLPGPNKQRGLKPSIFLS
jgi:hypothetical protein